MNNFDHKEISRRALIVAGWTNLEPNPQRGGWWRGTDPDGNEYQPAPRLTYNHTMALMYCLPHNPVIMFFDDGVRVFIGGSLVAQVEFAECEGGQIISLACALTMALAQLDGKEKQLALFEEATNGKM